MGLLLSGAFPLCSSHFGGTITGSSSASAGSDPFGLLRRLVRGRVQGRSQSGPCHWRSCKG